MRWIELLPKKVRQVGREQLTHIRNQRVYRQRQRTVSSLISQMGIQSRPPKDIPKHILLVAIDSLRRDHVSLYGYKRTTTPFLDDLAERATVFRDAVSASSWTYSSVASVLTGLYPHRHGGVYAEDPRDLNQGKMPQKVRDDMLFLPEILEPLGFSSYLGTAIVTAALPATGRFQTISAYHLRNAKELINHYLHWQRSQTGFSFAYVQIGDLHRPIDISEPYRSCFGEIPEIPKLADWDYLENAVPGDPGFERYRENRIKLYDAAIRHVDAQLERMIDELDSMGILDQMLIVITADHGEELWDHLELEREHFFDPRPAYGAGHGHHLWQEVVGVPLLILGPGIPVQEVNQRVSLVDLFPTVLEYLGVKRRSRLGLDGQNLFRQTDGRAILSEEISFGYEKKAVFEGKHKLYYSKGDGVRWIFDLERDPEEQTPLDLPEVSDRLIQYLPSGESKEEGTLSIDEETERRLRELGYID